MDTPTDSISLPRIVFKGLLLFIFFNILLALLNPLPLISKISLYNTLFPGRMRLPYGEKPELAYNLSLFSLDAMFASHEVAESKKPDEYRVVLIGDSSVWGFLLPPEETLGAKLNAAKMHSADGRRMRFYNLGYPTMSLVKDLLMLNHALAYQPDLIIWLVTLESMPIDKQLASPIVQHNSQAMTHLIETYSLSLNPDDSTFVRPSLLERTLIGQRRAIADLLRLQMYGVLWAATGVDQYYPDTYDPPQQNLSAELEFHGLQPPILQIDDLAMEAMTAGVEMANGIPVIIVNEPIYISQGENSHIRYNFFYPRWAYNQYRALLHLQCQTNGWNCLDLWDLVPASEYTNSAIHLTPAGEQMLAERLLEMLRTEIVH